MYKWEVLKISLIIQIRLKKKKAEYKKCKAVQQCSFKNKN